MEMGMGDGRPVKCGVLYGAAVKLGAVNTGPVKGSLPDPAHGKAAVAEIGKVKIRVIRYAVERHPVKVGFAEKVRGKTRLCRLVIETLVDDL